MRLTIQTGAVILPVTHIEREGGTYRMVERIPSRVVPMSVAEIVRDLTPELAHMVADAMLGARPTAS